MQSSRWSAQAREDATDWHDGQIAHGAHARGARRVNLDETILARGQEFADAARRGRARTLLFEGGIFLRCLLAELPGGFLPSVQDEP
jgi:hypothetical protein